MDDMTAFERQVAGRLQHHAGPISPVDDLAIFEAVASRSQKRWGFTMFSALKFVAAGVIVALFGGFLLAGVLTTQPSDEVVPAAVTDSPSPMAEGQRRVSGREVIELPIERGAAVTQWGSVTQHHGWVKRFSLAMDDPWAGGTGRYISNVDVIGAGPDAAGNMSGGVSRERGTLRIENESGAWEGPCDGVSRDGGGHIVGSCILTGSGEYEGYTYLHIHDWGVNGTTEGVIFPGVYMNEYPTLPPKPGS